YYAYFSFRGTALPLFAFGSMASILPEFSSLDLIWAGLSIIVGSPTFPTSRVESAYSGPVSFRQISRNCGTHLSPSSLPSKAPAKYIY
ncbi:uncharacterized protein EI90DRAFT_3042158, partial [Cantharellus anzutake]|uniref:uncharacterized protein n=1 Tax=Cantharellus anzutake TaxID=1750568 RepID=UPI0019048B41